MLRERTQKNVSRYLEQAQLEVRQRHFGLAVRWFSRAYALTPDAAILPELAHCLRKADLEQEALAIYDRILGSQPDPALRRRAEEELAILHALVGDEEVAISESVRSHIEGGRQAFLRAQYDAAIAEYGLAYAMLRLPRLLFNMGQAHRRAEQPDEAYLMYQRFLAEEPTGPLRKEATGYLTELYVVAWKPPVYRKAWFWGVIGSTAGLVVLSAIGLATGLHLQNPHTDGGTHVLSFGLTQRY